MTEENSERRRAHRYPISADVELPSGKGVTRDVSVSGLFLEIDDGLSEGDVLQFTLRLGDSRLACRGRVMRVERRGGKCGVGVKFEESQFE